MIHAQIDVPTIDAIRANRARLGELVITTPVRILVDDALAAAVGASTRVWLKEELFQRTGVVMTSSPSRARLARMASMVGASICARIMGEGRGPDEAGCVVLS